MYIEINKLPPSVESFSSELTLMNRTLAAGIGPNSGEDAMRGDMSGGGGGGGVNLNKT